MTSAVRTNRQSKGATRPTKGPSLRRSITEKLVTFSRLCAVGLFIFGFAFIGYQALKNMNSPLQEIQLSGEFDRTKSAEVEQTLAAYAGNGLLSLDLAHLQEQVETIPWVSKAQISRKWPSSLVVDLEMHRLVARWGQDSYVSDQGVVVTGYSVPEYLPLLQSEYQQAADILEQYRLLSQGLSQVELSLRELHQNQSGDLDLVLENGIRLKLGNRELLARVQRFIAVWSLDLHEYAGQINQIDVRYANGLAVNWNGSAELVLQQSTRVQPMGESYGELAGR